jgi:hypothetical protein
MAALSAAITGSGQKLGCFNAETLITFILLTLPEKFEQLLMTAV